MIKWHSIFFLTLLSAVVCGLPAHAATHTIRRAEVEKELAAQLLENVDADKVDVSLLGVYGDWEVETGAQAPAISITLEEADPRNGRFEASLRWRAEGEEHRERLRGKYNPMIEVPVVVRRFRSGQRIEAQDLGFDYVDARRLDKGMVMREGELIGKVTRRPLRMHQPVRRSDLDEPPVVERDDLVVMSYSVGNILLRTVGHALDTGAVGDMVRVRNASSKRVVHGRVAAPGEVEVGAEHILEARR